MSAASIAPLPFRGDFRAAFADLLGDGSRPVELYAMRREHELFYRKLKSHLHGGGNLFKAQTPESAAQDALAMMMAASLIARQRAAVAAKAGVEMKRVRFAKVLDATVAQCRVPEIGRGLIDEQHGRSGPDVSSKNWQSPP